MDFLRLEENIIDFIKEEQAKLGYQKEKVQIFYPLSSLNHLCRTNYGVEEMQACLEEFRLRDSEDWGYVKTSHKGDRFSMTIPEESVEKIHELTKSGEFIRKLVDAIGSHITSMDEIKKIFEQEGYAVAFEKIDNGEFDYLIRFLDDPEDTYYYCFKDEGCHITYHRFIKEDYDEMGF